MQSGLPFRKRRYQNLRECLRKAVWGNEKSAGTIAVDAGVDPSILSRWMNENTDDAVGKWVNQFIPLLIALDEKGIDIYEYIGEEIRAAQERTKEDEIAEAAHIVRHLAPLLPELQKAILALSRSKK